MVVPVVVVPNDVTASLASVSTHYYAGSQPIQEDISQNTESCGAEILGRTVSPPNSSTLTFVSPRVTMGVREKPATLTVPLPALATCENHFYHVFCQPAMSSIYGTLPKPSDFSGPLKSCKYLHFPGHSELAGENQISSQTNQKT